MFTLDATIDAVQTGKRCRSPTSCPCAAGRAGRGRIRAC